MFNAIALILYGDATSGLGKAFTGILRLTLIIGGFCCAWLAVFREKFDPLIRTFFLPAVAIVNCLLVPRTSVYIVDHIGWATKKVDNVPFFLGKFATLVSEMSYRLERLFTDRAHNPNDKMYDWTGNIYAGENIFKAKKCRITNPVLEDDFREFCRECVFRDIGIGLYTKDALMKTSNILKFLEENTSNLRTVFYKDPLQEGNSECLSCKEAMKKMNLLFNRKQANAKEIIFGEIGNQVQFLLGQKDLDLKNLIKQQIAIDLLKEEIPGTLHSFASKRAEILQKENQKILGALGASSLVAMRNFFEATIYMVFPIVLIVALLSFGIQAIIQWIQFVLWVNTWPLFYIVVNFLLNSIWDARRPSNTLTLFSSEGFADLYSSMESIAAIALAFIPYLSWILLKGGVSQMVHLASSIMAPAQSAASTASAEKMSGNYSFGNISLDNTNGYNAQMFRQTYSGMLSQGSVGIDTGSQTMTYAPLEDSLYLKQSDSYLREGVSRTAAFSSSLQDSLSSSQMALQESSNAVSASVTNSANKGVGLVEAVSRHLQKGESFNSQEMSSAQESFQYIRNFTEEYAETKGVSKDFAFRELLAAGAGFGVKGEFSAQDGVSRHSSDTESERGSESSGFQHHLQTIKSLSSGEVASILGSEDARLHQDFVQSLNETDSSMDQWRAAYSKQESLSNLQSYAESENLSVHQNLNQRFVEFLRGKYQDDIGQVIHATELNNLDPQKKTLIDEFVSDYLPGKVVAQDLGELTQPEPVSKKTFDEDKIGHNFGDLEKEINYMVSRIRTGKDDIAQDVNQDDGRHDSNKANVQTEIDRPITPFSLETFKTIGLTEPVEKLWNHLFKTENNDG